MLFREEKQNCLSNSHLKYNEALTEENFESDFI